MTSRTPRRCAGCADHAKGETNMDIFLQSQAWATFQRDLGHEVFVECTDDYSYVATLEGGRLSYLYVPYGPVAHSPEAFDAALADLTRLAKSKGAAFVRVEPVADGIFAPGEDPEKSLRDRGLKFAQRQIQPSHTWLVDLTDDEESLMKAMTATNRNLHRNIHKKGVTFEASHDPADIAVLLRYLNATAERVGFNRQKDDYLTQAAKSLVPSGAGTIYLARLDGEPIGAAFVYDSADTRTYAHASTAFEHRRLSANNPLVSHMMMDARAKGLTTFDMFGIAPEGDDDHEWAGFTKFKKSFGGYAATYAGTWDLPVNKPVYAAFRAAYAAKSSSAVSGARDFVAEARRDPKSAFTNAAAGARTKASEAKAKRSAGAWKKLD